MQAGADSGGTFTQTGDGTYRYTFKTKAAGKGGAALDLTTTHRIAAYGSRNLTEFDLGTYYDDDFFDFVPAGGAVTVKRDILRTETCNNCHDSLAAHGGSRRSVEDCDTCHTSQTKDPDTGQSVAMDVMIHKLHAGEELPSVKAGTPYQIIGHNQTVADWSTVVLPANGGARNCQSCHDQNSAAVQKTNFMTNPTRQACGSCHDDVNFATGKNHVSLPQLSDNNCKTCHTPQGDLEFDASILGAHTIANQAPSFPGLNLNITKVDQTAPGQAPLVTFTVRNNAGQGIPMSALTGGSNRLAFTLAGPTTDYGATALSTSTPGYVSETANTSSQCSADGTCTYQFKAKIPADAIGTFVVGGEARQSYTILPGTEQQTTTNIGAMNPVFYFSVDGTPIQKRRTIVTQAKCMACHELLPLHGGNRNNVEYCVVCHNPKNTDIAQRPNAQDVSQRTKPAQSINMAYMVHRIHMGERLAEVGADYTVIGFGGSTNDFSEVRYPVMSASGEVGTVTKCYVCHEGGSEANLPIGKLSVVNPQSLLSPAGATTSACTSCHPSTDVFAHAVQQTSAQFGESCAICHGDTADFNATKVHAGK
jgi:OmcA/MtrC family decaheme c-type cytochrome